MWSFFSKYLTSNNQVHISEENNIESNKMKIKTFDLFGRICKDKLFTPIIDMYDDGTMHKRMVID